jgi:hypothetical protein
VARAYSSASFSFQLDVIITGDYYWDQNKIEKEIKKYEPTILM